MESMARGCAALVVDDQAEARKLLGDRLEQVGFDLSFAEDGLAALGVFGASQPDLILTDRHMPRLDGIGLLRRIRQVSDVPVVMITAFASISGCEEAMRVGANRYLEFRRDLDRVASVACELVERKSSLSIRKDSRSITATGARLQAQQELRRSLEGLLVECRGNIAEMARRMGRDRSTIRYHLRRLGMLGEGRPARNDSSNLHS